MLLNCVAYQNGVKLADLPVEEISDYLERTDCFVWVALRDTTEAELEKMQEEFGLHDLAGVLDRQVVQTEFFLHLFEFGFGGIAQRHPDETIRPFKVIADFFDREVGEFDAVLVGNAIEQHGGLRSVYELSLIHISEPTRQ